MSLPVRGVLVAVVLVLGSASVASAAPPVASPRASTLAAGTTGLPPYDTWVRDVAEVTDQASAHLATRLPDARVKPAIVLDIDNTALESRYTGGLRTPATKPVLALARQAHDAGAAVIFVTARTEIIRLLTKDNLTAVGYPIDGLYMRGVFDFADNATLKTNARIRIEQAGYTIVASVGNSATDLAGGHAERTFKLPDYNGQLD
jgi:hypothetical protein